MSKDFYAALKDRRTIYTISKESPIPDEKILEVVQQAVKHVPSAFNSQSARIILLLGEQHNRLWDITMEALRKIVPPEYFADTELKINGFKGGYGSVLVFEDQNVVEELQKNFELYKDNFPLWSNHSSGMLQFVIWTSLEIEGFGASLQHYGALIEEQVKKEWNVPDKWKLIAQIPFGKPTAPPSEKEFKPIDERVKFYK